MKGQAFARLVWCQAPRSALLIKDTWEKDTWISRS
jgi:hypothetical protein